MGRQRGSTRTVPLAVGIVVATVGLTGCLGGKSGNDASTNTVPRTAAVGVSTAAASATKLATEACRQSAAAPSSNPTAAYPDYFAADAEIDLAGKLNPTAEWTNLASAFDAVKMEIQQIDTLQQAGAQSNSNTASNAAMLSQAVGFLRGDLAAVSTLCAADRI
jgi:hypothetical protein